MERVAFVQWIREGCQQDYVRAHAEIAAEYATLKARLAIEYRNDREAYTQAKSPFITRVTQLALQQA